MLGKRKKKGSATFIVIMLMTVILILSFSLVPLTLAGIRQGNMLIGRNNTYYTGEGTIDKMLHYIDVFSERARVSAYKKCFTDEKNPNLQNPYIKNIYDEYMEDTNPEKGLITFKKKLINYYKHEFNIAINAFFNKDKRDVISILEKSPSDESKDVLYTWDEVKSAVTNSSGKTTELVEALEKINDGSEFYRFIPEKSKDSTVENEEYKKEFSNIDFYKGDLEKLTDNPTVIPDNIYKDLTLRETFYVKSLGEKDEARYSSVTIDFDPIGRGKALESEKRETIPNKALTYGIISEDNLIAGNELTVNSDVIVGGQGEPDPTDSTKIIEYGGILAGVDTGLLQSINGGIPINDAGTDSKGIISINGNAYVGEVKNDYGVQSGFIETVNNGSKIKISKNAYSHSIVTNANSLNGENNNISIKKHVVGYEDGASMENNYLSSPAIVINNEDKDKKSTLKIDGQVALAGEGFVEDLKTNYNNKNVLFKTFETTAIYPNYVIYSNYLQSEEFNQFFRQYNIVDESGLENPTIDLLDKYSVMDSSIQNKPSFGIDFILSYFNEYGENIDPEYDLGYDSIFIPKININSRLDNTFIDNIKQYRSKIPEDSEDNLYQDLIGVDIDAIGNEFNNESSGLNISYFNYIMYANGNVYSTRKETEDTLNGSKNLELAKNVMNKYLNTAKKHSIDIVISDTEYDVVNVEGELKLVCHAIQKTLNRRLDMKDVVKYSDLKENNLYDKYKDKGLKRCFNWDELDRNSNNGEIKYNEGDVYVHISKKPITVTEAELKGKEAVFIVSENNVIVNAADDISINGNIMSKKNIITRGGAVEVTANPDTAKKISEINDARLQNFLKPGSLVGKQTVTGISKVINTNIDIIGRRQLLN